MSDSLLENFRGCLLGGWPLEMRWALHLKVWTRLRFIRFLAGWLR